MLRFRLFWRVVFWRVVLLASEFPKSEFVFQSVQIDDRGPIEADQGEGVREMQLLTGHGDQCLAVQKILHVPKRKTQGVDLRTEPTDQMQFAWNRRLLGSGFIQLGITYLGLIHLWETAGVRAQALGVLGESERRKSPGHSR